MFVGFKSGLKTYVTVLSQAGNCVVLKGTKIGYESIPTMTVFAAGQVVIDNVCT